jgi:hypothetical protein
MRRSRKALSNDVSILASNTMQAILWSVLLFLWRAKIITFYKGLPFYIGPNDPEVIIKIDITNTTCRALTLDVLRWRAFRDYACDLKHGDAIRTCENLSN